LPQHTIFITSPLEAEHVETIRSVSPEIRILYEPDLLPTPRYVADHKGAPLERSAEQELRRQSCLRRPTSCGIFLHWGATAKALCAVHRKSAGCRRRAPGSDSS